MQIVVDTHDVVLKVDAERQKCFHITRHFPTQQRHELLRAAFAICLKTRCVNLVGYQNKEVVDSNAGGFTWCLSTLPSVGAAKNALTLSSWKVTPPEGGLWSAASGSQSISNIFGGAKTAAAGGIRDWQAVPEPTSGLLLLLGVAGLALRRRRA